MTDTDTPRAAAPALAVGGRLSTALFTALAMVAFAANSVICRAALGGHAIDAAGFTLIRLGSGALVLAALHNGSRRAGSRRRGFVQPALLFTYAAAFSFAYLSLSVATGALILFGTVQATMLLVALGTGERFRVLEGTGLALALAGLASLVAPGLTAPSPVGAALMATAGIAWGVYSVRGRGTTSALADTQHDFLFAAGLAMLLAALAIRGIHMSPRGVMLALLSGVVTSGLGYVAWFVALRGLTVIGGAIVQLSSPALAALGGVVFLSEQLSLRVVVSAGLIFAGVGIAVLRFTRWAQEHLDA